jgi:hypothetical protein
VSAAITAWLTVSVFRESPASRFKEGAPGSRLKCQCWLAGENRKGSRMKGPLEETRCTLEEALTSIVLASPIDHDRWKLSIEHGASDDEIRSTLTFSLGRTGQRVSSSPGICQLSTKPKLRFWLGSYGSGEPTLEGKPLVDRIRQVLSIPPAPDEEDSSALSQTRTEVTSETLSQEIVESLLPDAPASDPDPELVQIEKASVAAETVVSEVDLLPPQEQLAFVFDYSELDDDKAAVVRQATTEIRERLLSIRSRTLEIATRLLLVKRNLNRGQWGRWVAADTGLSVDTADRLVQVGETLEQFPQIAENAEHINLRRTEWYLLSAPTTPDSARKEVAELAEAKEPITGPVVREVVERHKPIPEGIRDEVNNVGATHQTGERPVKTVDAELVAVGKGLDELLRLLKRTPSGMLMANLVQMGFQIPVLDRGVRERLIDRTVEGHCSYNWQPGDVVQALRSGPLSLGELQNLGCQRYAVLSAEGSGLIRLAKGGGYQIVEQESETEEEPETSTPTTASTKTVVVTAAAPPAKAEARVEDLLKGRMLVVAFTWIPELPGKVSVGVRVGSDATKTAYETIEAAKVRGFPESVQQMIAERLKSASSMPTATAKKPKAKSIKAAKTSKKATARKPAVARKSTTTAKTKRPTKSKGVRKR